MTIFRKVDFTSDDLYVKISDMINCSISILNSIRCTYLKWELLKSMNLKFIKFWSHGVPSIFKWDVTWELEDENNSPNYRPVNIDHKFCFVLVENCNTVRCIIPLLMCMTRLSCRNAS